MSKVYQYIVILVLVIFYYSVEKEGSEGLDAQEIIIQPNLHYPDIVNDVA